MTDGSGFDAARYLERIVYSGSLEPTYDVLQALQVAHMVHVPFENLDVYHRRGVQVGLDHSVHKIVERRRGGWCFELNGGFAALLTTIGFDVDLLSCRTYEPESGGLSDPFDHLALLVGVGGERYLTDVGWGDNALRPLPAEPGDYEASPRPARIETTPTAIRRIELVERVDGDTVWELQYEADRTPRKLGEFADRSTYLQTEPGLIWTERPLVTRATSSEGGRVSLHRDRLRTRHDDQTIVDEEVTPDGWAAALSVHFGIDEP